MEDHVQENSEVARSRGLWQTMKLEGERGGNQTLATDWQSQKEFLRGK